MLSMSVNDCVVHKNRNISMKTNRERVIEAVNVKLFPCFHALSRRQEIRIIDDIMI